MTLSISESLNTNFINAVLNEFELDELFLMQDIEFIINTLSNKTFAHRLILMNDIILASNIKLVSYSYISFTDSRYDDREFKDLLIDSDAARKSIEEMRQFKALQRISDDVKLNKSDRLVFKFEIKDTKSVDSIELKISLEMIIFHIVEINILFLLSLINLDCLSVYFNNLINKLMQDYLSSITIILQIDMKNNRC